MSQGLLSKKGRRPALRIYLFKTLEGFARIAHLITAASTAIRWKLCRVSSLAMMLSLVLQIHYWIVRGREWNAFYASTQGDEFLNRVPHRIDGPRVRKTKLSRRTSPNASSLERTNANT